MAEPKTPCTCITAHDRMVCVGWCREEAPHVCPGCHAVAPERCAPGCIDDEIEREHREAIESGDYDRFDDEDDDG